MTMSHPVITDVGFRGNPAHESSAVKVLARAGRARPPGRNIKRRLQLRYTTHVFWICGMSGRRTGTNLVKAKPAMKTSSNAIAGTTGVRAAAWGQRTGRVNWGPSEAGGLRSEERRVGKEGRGRGA